MFKFKRARIYIRRDTHMTKATKTTKTIPVRFDDEAVWLQFKKKLLEDGVSAQEFFLDKVMEYLKSGPGAGNKGGIKMLRKITTKELAEELIKKFSSWVGTPSEELLEDGGTVIDHLTDAGRRYDRGTLEAIPDDVWEKAWEIFDQKVGRKV